MNPHAQSAMRDPQAELLTRWNTPEGRLSNTLELTHVESADRLRDRIEALLIGEKISEGESEELLEVLRGKQRGAGSRVHLEARIADFSDGRDGSDEMEGESDAGADTRPRLTL